MSIAVVDYDAGNLRSVETALKRIGLDYQISANPAEIRTAKRVIFPGVGQAGHAMQVLQERGIADALRDRVQAERPVLGICLGCQIVLSTSEEGNVDCLDLIPGCAVRFPVAGGSTDWQLKVPHMGWNEVQHDESHWLFQGIPSGVSFYFVHSYYPRLQDDAHSIAQTDYGLRFTSAMERGSLVAVQFHPEKSGEYGIRMLENYCRRS
jgi:glutamine amidotransferase